MKMTPSCLGEDFAEKLTEMMGPETLYHFFGVKCKYELGYIEESHSIELLSFEATKFLQCMASKPGKDAVNIIATGIEVFKFNPVTILFHRVIPNEGTMHVILSIDGEGAIICIPSKIFMEVEKTTKSMSPKLKKFFSGEYPKVNAGLN